MATCLLFALPTGVMGWVIGGGSWGCSKGMTLCARDCHWKTRMLIPRTPVAMGQQSYGRQMLCQSSEDSTSVGVGWRELHTSVVQLKHDSRIEFPLLSLTTMPLKTSTNLTDLPSYPLRLKKHITIACPQQELATNFKLTPVNRSFLWRLKAHRKGYFCCRHLL